MTIVAAPAAPAAVTAVASKSCAISTIATAVALLSGLVSAKPSQPILRTGVTTKALLVRLRRRQTRLSSLTSRVGSRTRAARLSDRRRGRPRSSLVTERLQRVLSASLRRRLLLSIGLALAGKDTLVAAENIRHATECTTAGSVLLSLRGLRRAGAVITESTTEPAVTTMHRGTSKRTDVGGRGAVSVIGRLRRHTVGVVGLTVHALAEGSTVALAAIATAVVVHVRVEVRRVVVGVLAVREAAVAGLAMGLVHVLRLSCGMMLSSHGGNGGVVTAVLSVTVTALVL